MKHKTLILDGYSLTIEDVYHTAHNHDMRITISEEALREMKKSRDWVEKIASEGLPVVYGINTGFGSKASVYIGKEKLKDLQRNLIKSHSAGAGEMVPIPVVRAAMLLRANTLAKGYSGIRPKVVQLLLDMLQKQVIPAIPIQGSVGASGDLAPLSHMALVLSKDIHPEYDTEEESGMAYLFNPELNDYELLPGKEAMKRAGLERIVLEAKEGLALNNGTQISTAIAALVIYETELLLKTADATMALTLESLLGNSSPFHPKIQAVRPHPGQKITAENIRKLIVHSKLIDSHPQKVQDAYSIRCYPQVAGAIRETLSFAKNIVEREINAANDNPLIFPDLESENKTLSGGNFHGEPVAFAMDFMAIALSELASISERRIFRLVTNYLNYGLPSFLIKESGLENGLMIAQYTAASIVSENKAFSHPASVDSIPTCEDQEDHVSMSPIAARKALNILENTRTVLAIELLSAYQAARLRTEKQSPEELLGDGSYRIYSFLSDYILPLEKDRVISNDIDLVKRIINSSDWHNLIASLDLE
ncbi:MAG: histidine ammonia-lyase [Calditrichia bacterium]